MSTHYVSQGRGAGQGHHRARDPAEPHHPARRAQQGTAGPVRSRQGGRPVRSACAGAGSGTYHIDWANVVRGNPHDTMLHLLCRMWFAERGRLTRGDLVWVADQLDEASGEVPEKDRGRTWPTGSCATSRRSRCREPSQKHVARAMTWATETIKPNKRKKVLEHVDVLRSDFIKGDALERYEKGRDVYRLACSLCAICVKNAGRLSEQAICGIIEQIDAFLADETPPESELVSAPAPFELVLTP